MAREAIANQNESVGHNAFPANLLSNHFDITQDIQSTTTTTTKSTLIPHSSGSTLLESVTKETTYEQGEASLVTTMKETLVADVSTNATVDEVNIVQMIRQINTSLGSK